MDVFGTALRLTRNRDAALELANSVFFKAFQNLHAYDDTRPLRPWLIRIATNDTLNWLRSQRRERDHVLEGESGELALELTQGSETEDPEYAALLREKREAVRDALMLLPERYRVVLTLRFFDDLSYAEIAEITGQDTNAVGVQLLRARNLLKKALTEGVEGTNGTDS